MIHRAHAVALTVVVLGAAELSGSSEVGFGEAASTLETSIVQEGSVLER
jgi:hypothetical protein